MHTKSSSAFTKHPFIQRFLATQKRGYLRDVKSKEGFLTTQPKLPKQPVPSPGSNSISLVTSL